MNEEKDIKKDAITPPVKIKEVESAVKPGLKNKEDIVSNW